MSQGTGCLHITLILAKEISAQHLHRERYYGRRGMRFISRAGLSNDNDGIKHLLSVIYDFSIYQHVVPLKSKTGPSVTASFQSVLKDRRYSKPVRRRPVWLQTDGGKEFSNRPFQDLLKRERIQFHVYRNPDVICAVVERAHWTL